MAAIDALAPEAYDVRLYDTALEAQPIEGWAEFGVAQVDQYRTLGFVSVNQAFADDVLRGVGDAFRAYVVDEATIPAGVELQYEFAAKDVLETLDPEDRLDYVRKLMWFVRHDERFQRVAYAPELISAVTKLLGAEPEMFQEMALFKPPGIGREKPWHQDHAYFNLPEGTPVVGVWIAMDEALLANGCMVFLPGGHREGPIPHFNRRDWQICDSEILTRHGAVAAPLKPGGCVIFDGLTPHGTPANLSGLRRRAIQFHYVAKGTPRTTVEERMALFGSEGRNVSC
jgi:ectoine hydroxylase-related dioxygenase (phytanoyl-CoA dioxygenase family)